jgi:hypothetical protein
MGVRKAAKRRFLPRVALVLVALLATTATVAVGLTSSDSRHASLKQAPPSPAPHSSTPMRKVNLSALPIARRPFCTLLPRGDVEDALAGKVTKATQYGNGTKTKIAPGLADVSHEYNCTFDGANGSQARVWVFAQPVQTGTAKFLARQALKAPGCQKAKAPKFGTPTASTLCRANSPKATVVTLRGLFGEAWLSCQLTAPGTEAPTAAERRADDWCVKVATALGARP